MLIYLSQDGNVPSGVAVYGYTFLQNLPEARMLLLNADRYPVAAPEELHKHIVCVPEDKSHSPVMVARVLAQMVTEEPGQIVILPNTGDTPWAAVTEFLKNLDKKTLSRVRVLGIIHSDMETQYSLAETYFPIAPMWLGVSAHCTHKLQARLAPLGGKAHKLFLPVDIPANVPARSVTSNVPLKIAYVGRLDEPQKRVSRLIEVFTELARRKVNFLATVGGDGPAAVEFKKKLNSAGLEKYVHMTGSLSRTAINDLWARHDVFILTSAYEGLPLALLEAMAMELCPVVMAVDSGLPELLVNAKNAYVVPQGNVESMASALEYLAKNRSDLSRLGAAARQTVAAQFSIKRHFETLQRLLHDIWARPAPVPEKIPPDVTVAAVEKLVKKLEETKRPVVVYGTGMFGRKIVDACLDKSLKVIAMLDSDSTRKGSVYRDIICHSADEVANFQDAAFAVGSLQFVAPISERITGAFATAQLKTPLVVSAL